jgi:hypothetical protein
MFDLFLGLRQAVEGGAQNQVEIAGSRPLFRDFWVFGIMQRVWGCLPMALPCLGLFFNV